jgi:hypothetical protein
MPPRQDDGNRTERVMDSIGPCRKNVLRMNLTLSA